MTPARVDAAAWHVRHRPMDDTLAEAGLLTVRALMPGEAIDRARADLPAGHILTSVARH